MRRFGTSVKMEVLDQICKNVVPIPVPCSANMPQAFTNQMTMKNASKSEAMTSQTPVPNSETTATATPTSESAVQTPVQSGIASHLESHKLKIPTVALN